MVCAIVEMTAKRRGFLSACVIVSVRGSTSCPYPYLGLSARSAFKSLFLSTATRRDTLGKLSKNGMLVKFLQGDTDDADVEKDVSHAWDVCKESARKTLEAQGITEWPLRGSYRTAYMALLKLRKNQKQPFDNLAKRTVDTTPKRPVRIQTAIMAYFNKDGQLEDMQGALEVDERLVGVTHDAVARTPRSLEHHHAISVTSAVL